MHLVWADLAVVGMFMAGLLLARAAAGRATIRLSGFAAFFVYGCAGAPLFSVLLQWLVLAAVPIQQRSAVASVLAPLIEAVAAALPVILLAFATSAWRRLSIADLALAGFASGAGLSVVEWCLQGSAGQAALFANLTLGLQSARAGGHIAYFAGHGVNAALFAVAAGAALRMFSLPRLYVWMPAAAMLVWGAFDRSQYVWQALHPSTAPALSLFTVAGIVEGFHLLTIHGQLAVWLLPMALIAAQAAEARACTKLLGKRSDLLLPREIGRWVLNEWLVAVLRIPDGRVAVVQTLAFFRLRRAFAIATLEAHRDPGNRALAQYTRVLEQRLVRDRVVLVKPPRGVWLLPRAILERSAKALLWRVRWILGFGMLGAFVVLARLFFGADAFSDALAWPVAGCGLSFAVWRTYRFFRSARLDAVVGDGAAFAMRYGRGLLLSAALASGLFALLLLVAGPPGGDAAAGFIGGMAAHWNSASLALLLGLAAFGSAVEADPAAAGAALENEIEIGTRRLIRLERELDQAAAIDDIVARMVVLDAERGAQARRQLALDACERHAGDMHAASLGVAFQTVIETFEVMRSEFDAAVLKQRASIDGLQQIHTSGLMAVLEALDAHDAAHEHSRAPLVSAAAEIPEAPSPVEEIPAALADPDDLEIVDTAASSPLGEDVAWLDPCVETEAADAAVAMPEVAETPAAAQTIIDQPIVIEQQPSAARNLPMIVPTPPEQRQAERWRAATMRVTASRSDAVILLPPPAAERPAVAKTPAMPARAPEANAEPAAAAPALEIAPQPPRGAEASLLAGIAAPGWSTESHEQTETPAIMPPATADSAHTHEPAAAEPFIAAAPAATDAEEPWHIQLQELFYSAPPQPPKTEAASEDEPPTGPIPPPAPDARGESDPATDLSPLFEVLARLESAVAAKRDERAKPRRARVSGARAKEPPSSDAAKTPEPVVPPRAPASAPTRAPAPVPAPEPESLGPLPKVEPLFGVARNRAKTEQIVLQPTLATPPPAQGDAVEKTAEPIRTRAQKFREGVDGPARNQNGAEQPKRESTASGSPPPADSQSRVRNTARGKFIKPEAPTTATVHPLPASNAASIRSAKFYSSGPVTRSNAVQPNTAAAPPADKAGESNLAEALSEYYGKNGEVPPPMHTVDIQTFEKIVGCGRLDTGRKGAAAWSYSGIPRRGDVAIRLKRGADRFVEFVPSNITFGQTPVFYPKRVGVGEPETAIPVEHLEFFDIAAGRWRSLARSVAA